ncbi:hypothetical protein KDL45_03195, partial [bacterium]|nr:hypothetical protein [bacterium]
ETKLIAHERTPEQIAEIMGSDGTYFVSHEGLMRGLELSKDRLCMACLTRRYPTDVTEAVRRVEHRRRERDDSLAIESAC